jgi:hypothetical protein
MLNTLERLKNSQKLTQMKFARISKLELLHDHGLELEAFAKFSQLWMTEAIIWTLMISDGVLSILDFKFQKKKVTSSLKNLIWIIVVRLITLASLVISEET